MSDSGVSSSVSAAAGLAAWGCLSTTSEVGIAVALTVLVFFVRRAIILAYVL